MFSIVIPTLNNLDYIKLCIRSIKQNSKFSHEIIVFVNDGSDGTLDFIKYEKIKYLHSKKNLGLCKAVNQAAKLASNKYLVYSHDDMYFCPGWDEEFYKEIKNYKNEENYYLSATMIQPFESFINLDCGNSAQDFNEKKLLSEYKNTHFNDFQGSTWAPHLIPINTWNKISGFSEEYSFGIGSDPDLNMKLWKIGTRIHKGLGNCRVYHFGSITLRKKVTNDGNKIFLKKWGITPRFFKKYYLRSDQLFDGELKKPNINFSFIIGYLICKFKLIKIKISEIFK